MRSRKTRNALALAGALSLALTLGACSDKGGGSNAAAESIGIKTGEGIQGNTITLGVLGDFTGPFAALTTDLNRGVELYWEEVNQAGGVCERFDVKLDIKDHGYNVQNAVSIYSQMTPNVLAYQAFIGGSHTGAVLEQAEADHRLIFPASATQHLAESEVIMLPAMYYSLDMELVVAYLEEQALVKKGDTVGVIYLEGDYGESAHQGAVAAAERMGLTLKEFMVKATDADMTAQVNEAVRAGASAILVGSVPAHTSSVGAVLESSGKNVAIGGSWPSYTQSMLKNTGGEYLEKHFYAASPATTYDTERGKELYAKLQKKFPGVTLTNQAAMGYGMAGSLHAVMKDACKAGDLTPKGLVEAKKNMAPLATTGIIPDMNYKELGKSPTRSAYMFRMDREVPGALQNVMKTADGLYTSDKLGK